MATSTFNHVNGLHPRRSRFNISYGKALDCDMGQLIPSMVKFMVPGDIFTFHQEVVARPKAPLRAPCFADINCFSYNFFVPLRILFGESKTDVNGEYEWDVDDKAFGKFLNGGRTGKDNSVVLPRWVPTGTDIVNDNWNGIPAPGEGEDPNGSNIDDVNVTVKDNGIYSLWDYLEMPTGVIPNGAYPLDFAKRAYNLIYNEWFLDRNCMTPVAVEANDRVMQATWKKDYFTSMLPWQQRGEQPRLPVTFFGSASVAFSRDTSDVHFIDSASYRYLDLGSVAGKPNSLNLFGSTDGSVPADAGTSVSASVDLSHLSASSVSISDLRVAFQIQRWMEKSAQIGSRYVEYLRGMYGVSPNDDTLQRPMFIGGSKSPVIISEVLQTSADGNDGVGSLKGHGIMADRNYMGRFRANEFGIMMTLSVIRPKAMYHQGIDREYLYSDRYSFYNPAFVSLSEQAVEVAEILATNDGNVDANGDPVYLGYQGRYNELRTSMSKVCGALRGDQNMSFWALTRTFDSKPELNGQFLKCIPKKDIFEVTDEPAFVVYFNNRITGYRPLPVDAQPGFVDHLYGERR